MKPTQLKAGQKVIYKGFGDPLAMTFVRRDAYPKPSNWFQCDAFRGLSGPDDKGFTRMSDYDVSRKIFTA